MAGKRRMERKIKIDTDTYNKLITGEQQSGDYDTP